jgi:hypothetical protein
MVSSLTVVFVLLQLSVLEVRLDLRHPKDRKEDEGYRRDCQDL